MFDLIIKADLIIATLIALLGMGVQTFRLGLAQAALREAMRQIGECRQMIRDDTEILSTAYQILTDAHNGKLKDSYDVPQRDFDKKLTPASGALRVNQHRGSDPEWPDELGEK